MTAKAAKDTAIAGTRFEGSGVPRQAVYLCVQCFSHLRSLTVNLARFFLADQQNEKEPLLGLLGRSSDDSAREPTQTG